VEQKYEWSPETKFGPFVGGSSLHSNNSKLSDITAGKQSVKPQFITNNSNKAMASEWCQSSTRGFHKVSKKLQQKADLLSFKEIQCTE